MPYENLHILIGHLGQDPELKYTSGGQAICSCSVATSHVWKDAKGEWQNKTTWHKVTIWGKSGEKLASEAHKGNLVYVRGRVETDSFTDRDGNKRYSTKTVADYARVLSYTQGHKSENQESNDDSGQEVGDDEIPF